MNTPNRPHEELDADERELARVVRALPGNEPPAALDLRILRAAQDAVASTPQKRTRRALWASSAAGGSFWGIGTAAAAVLAFGISWQVLMRAPSSNLPASGPAAIAENGARDRDATPVDFVGAPEADKDAAGQPASAAASDSALASASQPMPQVQQRASAAEPMRQESKPADEPQAFIDEHVAAAEEAQQRTDILKSSADSRDDAAAMGSAVAENAPAESDANAAPAAAMVAPAAPAPPPTLDAERREQAFAKTTSETGMLAGGAAPAAQVAAPARPSIAESDAAIKHRVRLDARLYPESWILKIRSRLRHGDTAGARASLRLFVEHYPQEMVPDNLKPLLDP